MGGHVRRPPPPGLLHRYETGPALCHGDGGPDPERVSGGPVDSGGGGPAPDRVRDGSRGIMALGDIRSGPYGSFREERAYLSRLQASALGAGGRGVMTGSETVDELFALLRRTSRGRLVAKAFRRKHGDGNFGFERRTEARPVHLAPEDAYR